MKNFLIVLFGVCGLSIYSTYAIQHNLFYGHCTYDNNTVPIYTQEISMDNPSSNQVTVRPVRRWYDSITNIFRSRSATTTPPPNDIGNVFNTTVAFPPAGNENALLIKCIQVIDNIQDGTGAFASIIDGGVNLNHTKVLLKSQPGGKINSKVTIFSYRNPMSAQPIPHDYKVPSYHHPSNRIQHSPPQPPQQRPHFPWPTLYKKK